MVILKKGAVSISFIIGIILAVAAFIPVLYLLTNFSQEDFGPEAVCEFSVLTRATTPAVAQSYVPLRCTTKKICLTKELFGECEQFSGEEEVVRVRLKGSNENMARKIEEVNVRSKYDCWRAMGEGKLDLFGDFWREIGLEGEHGNSTCVICSRIAIDKGSFSDACKKESFDKEECEDALEETLGLVDMNEYMENNNVPGLELTYVEMFTNRGISKIAKPNLDHKNKESFEQQFNEELIKDPKFRNVANNFERLDDDFDLELERAYVFSQVKQPKTSDVLDNLATLAGLGIPIVSGAAITPVVGKAAYHPYVLIPGLVIAGGTATYAYFNNEAGIEAAGTYCGNLQSSIVGKENTEQIGCSVVQGVPYDFEYVNSMCRSIQGNP